MPVHNNGLIQQLIDAIAETLVGDGKARERTELRSQLVKDATEIVTKKRGVRGVIPPMKGMRVELKEHDAKRTLERWMKEHKPQLKNVHIFVHILDELGNAKIKAEEARKEFSAKLAKLASEFGTSLDRVRRTFAPQIVEEEKPAHPLFATLELRTGRTQMQDGLPFAQDQGYYYAYRRLTGNARNVYRELLVINENRTTRRCYGGTFFSWSKREWACTIVPGELSLTFLMNAYDDKASPSRPPMHELMRVKRRELGKRFPYMTGLRLGLDDAANSPAAVRVVLEKLEPSVGPRGEITLEAARRFAKKAVRAMKPSDAKYKGLRRALFPNGDNETGDNAGVIRVITKDVLGHLDGHMPVARKASKKGKRAKRAKQRRKK